MVLALVLALSILCVVGVVSAVVASARDSRSPTRTVWGYDTRHPLP